MQQPRLNSRQTPVKSVDEQWSLEIEEIRKTISYEARRSRPFDSEEITSEMTAFFLAHKWHRQYPLPYVKRLAQKRTRIHLKELSERDEREVPASQLKFDYDFDNDKDDIIENAFSPPVSGGVSENESFADSCAVLREAVMRLDDLGFAVIYGFYFERKTRVELAEELNLTPNQVHSRLQRALRELQRDSELIEYCRGG